MLIIAWMDDCESPEYPYNVAGGPSRAIYLLLKIGLVWPILTTVWVYLESGNRIPYKDISHPQFHEKKRPLWDFETRMKGFGGHHLRTDYFGFAKDRILVLKWDPTPSKLTIGHDYVLNHDLYFLHDLFNSTKLKQQIHLPSTSTNRGGVLFYKNNL